MDANTINLALQMLAVGMMAVTTVLTLVAVVSRALIWATNRLAEGQIFPGKTPAPGDPGLPDDEVAALMAAVQVATGGRGRVTEIRVIDNAD
jgi:hypothetical protein